MAGSALVSGPVAVRNAVAFGRDPLGFLDELRGGDEVMVRARFGLGPSLRFVTDPAAVETVLVDDHGRYWRPDILSSRTRALTRNGLIQSDGDLWRAQRSRLQPLFGTDRIAAYTASIGTETAAVLDDWRDGDTVRLYEEMSKITVRVIANALLGIHLSEEEISRIRRTSAAVAAEFTVSPTALVRQLLPTPPSTEYRAAIDETHAWADRVIDRQRTDPPDEETLVTVMLEAERDSETDVDAELLRDEVLTVLFAGYETTALTLSFALWFTAQRPTLTERVREEVRAAETDGTLGWEALPQLETSRRIVRETLRLRPPSWGIFREARERTQLGGADVREGDFLMLPQWTLHRDDRFFSAPETFDPSRWIDRDPNDTAAYFPFGAGPQSCIGGRLAMTEATLVLASVVDEFVLEPTADSVDRLRPAGVLQPRDGVPARVERREDIRETTR